MNKRPIGTPTHCFYDLDSRQAAEQVRPGLRTGRYRAVLRSTTIFWLSALLVFISSHVAVAAEPPVAAPVGQLAEQQPLPAAVQAVLAANPTTPAELVRAARILAGLDQSDRARGMLKRVLEAQLDTAALAQLAEMLGSPAFVQLAADPRLQPEGAELSGRVLEAWRQHVQSPERIAEYIVALTDQSESRRAAAVRGLLAARHAAIGPLFGVLTDPQRRAEHAACRAVLAAMGVEAVGPLVAIVGCDDNAAAAEAASILGEINGKDSYLFLLAPALAQHSPEAVRTAAAAALRRMRGAVPSEAEAAWLLARRAEQLHLRLEPLEGVVQGEITRWHFDAQKRQLTGQPVSEAEMRRALAARFALDAHELAPEDRRIRTLHLATMLEEAAYRHGRDRPLPDTTIQRASSFGAETVEEVLRHCLSHRRGAAAAAAIDILVRLGDAESLVARGARPTPLVLGLSDPDRRVRLAAARAVSALGPEQPFPGSSQLAPALAWFANTSGQPRVLLAGPITADLRRMAAPLLEKGIRAEVVVTGSEAVRAASASPDDLCIILDMQISHPSVDVVVQQLRRDPRTAEVPIGLFTREPMFAAAERLARAHRKVVAQPRPHHDEVVLSQFEELTRLWGEDSIDPQQCIEQAAEAIRLIDRWSKSDARWFDWRQTEPAILAAMNVPALTAAALELAARFGTPTAQRALVQFASHDGRPIELRQQAVRCFADAVAKHGLLLTTIEIEQQYDLYNGSAAAPAETQKVLSDILDVIESPLKARIEAEKSRRKPGSETRQPDQAGTHANERSEDSNR